jgi:hypothetical protein
MAVLALLLASCGLPSGAPRADVLGADASRVVRPSVRGLVATLEDEVHELPGERMAWATYWKLCWEDYPGARTYELQTLTGEGASPKLRRQSERCLRLEVVKGENAKKLGFVNREVLLALQAGQLAYRVRAVLDEGRVSDWSSPVAAGKVTGRATR